MSQQGDDKPIVTIADNLRAEHLQGELLRWMMAQQNRPVIGASIEAIKKSIAYLTDEITSCKDATKDRGREADDASQFDGLCEPLEKSLGVLQQRLNLLEQALRRIEDLTYGRCETCGAYIETEVLVAEPASTLCLTHKAAASAVS